MKTINWNELIIGNEYYIFDERLSKIGFSGKKKGVYIGLFNYESNNFRMRIDNNIYNNNNNNQNLNNIWAKFTNLKDVSHSNSKKISGLGNSLINHFSINTSQFFIPINTNIRKKIEFTWLKEKNARLMWINHSIDSCTFNLDSKKKYDISSYFDNWI